MIVVIASAYDVRAKNIVARWQTQGATMLSAEDMCAHGWRMTVPYEERQAMAVIAGKTVPASAIRGIVTLRPCIFPEELQNVQADQRKYVAAECNAFLLAWLTAQTCPVLNRPTPGCLSGPNWPHEKWVALAAGLGIPARTRRSIPTQPHETPGDRIIEVIAVGDQCFGTDDATLARWTMQLARIAQMELLSVRFSADDGRFVAASIWPPLTDPAVLEAVSRRLADQR
jgi:hypothetical protein